MYPRPFLRTPSKCHLVSSCDHESSDVKATPQHVVIGFNLTSEDRKHQENACDSPRSVLESSGACVSGVPDQSRSPRSILGCLFSGQQTQQPFKGAVGLGVSAAIEPEELPMLHTSNKSVLGSKPDAISKQNRDEIGVHSRKECNSTIVEDALVSYSGVLRDDDMDGFDLDEDHGRGMQESIFCASSPFSARCSLEYSTGDFLSVCFFCKCHLLHGKDVYMYKGDKAFCSPECRYQQIVVDEFKERQSAAANCYAGASNRNVPDMFAGASAARA